MQSEQRWANGIKSSTASVRKAGEMLVRPNYQAAFLWQNEQYWIEQDRREMLLLYPQKASRTRYLYHKIEIIGIFM